MRIKNYDLIHQLLKSSKDLHKISGMEKVAVNQDLTKIRNKLAYDARQLVKTTRRSPRISGTVKFSSLITTTANTTVHPFETKPQLSHIIDST